MFFLKKRRRKENVQDISTRKPQKALKTIWDSDAAEASLRLLFSTFSGQSLSHPIWINCWASRSSSTFLSNEISLKITHCRSDIRALVFHGWTQKAIHYILMFSDHIIWGYLELGHHHKLTLKLIKTIGGYFCYSCSILNTWKTLHR